MVNVRRRSVRAAELEHRNRIQEAVQRFPHFSTTFARIAAGNSDTSASSCCATAPIASLGVYSLFFSVVMLLLRG